MQPPSGQVFSLWIGPQSQQLAHHFYALQSQQFFDQSQDPLNHNYIWKLLDKNGQQKKPYFLTFDTQIPHLNHLRHVNHKKLITQMQKSNMGLQDYYFNLSKQVKNNKKQQKQKQQQSDQPQPYLYKRWQSSQSNYCIIDKNFIQDCESFEFWKQIYKANSQQYQDRIRKKLQSFDCLQNVTLTTDLEKSGFASQVVVYFKDQCPKNDIVFFQLQTNKENKKMDQINKMENLAEIGSMVDVFFSFKADVPKFAYFETQSYNPFIHIAPIMNCILTPLFLKTRTPGNFLNNLLINPRRNIFDFAYTLPLIDTDLNLARFTNIFDYLLTGKHQKFFQAQQSNLKVQNHQQQVFDMYYENKKNIEQGQVESNNSNNQTQFNNRINYGCDYLHLYNNKNNSNPIHFYNQQLKQQNQFKQLLYKGILSESFILKGHIKHFQKVFQPSTQLLDLKYLQGILCNYQDNKAKYTKNYIKEYGNQIVENYPFHCVMFQHELFGDYLRGVVAKGGKNKNKNGKKEGEEQWMENLLSQADLYKEVQEEGDD